MSTMETAKQAEQTTQVKRARRFHLTKNDKALLMDLFRVRVMMVRDMQENYFNGNSGNASYRLGRLEQNGYIESAWYRPKTHGKMGQIGKFVAITEKGVQVVLDDMGYAELELSNVDYKPDSKSLAKFLLAASVYLEQGEQLEQDGWDWEPGYVMRRIYGNDLRYPAIGYLRHIQKGVVVPVFMLLNQWTGRGVKGRVEKAINNLAEILHEGVKLGRYTVITNILFVPDELFEFALLKMKHYATSPFKLIPLSDAKQYLTYAIGDSVPKGIRLTESEAGDAFPWLIQSSGGTMYYANLLKYNPVEFWKVVGYNRKKAEDDARYKERPLRPVCAVVSDMQAQLIRKLASDTSMLALVDRSFTFIKDESET